MTEPNFSAIRARLRYDSVDEFIDGYSRYVTAGGMFIPMTPAKLKPVGTTVRFQFVLGDGATALLGEGVVRQIRGLENEDADSPIGMLVKFTKLSQDSKILIDRIIALKEIEKLGVDIFSEQAHSEVDDGESEEQTATTGNYSLAELTHSAGGSLAGADSDDLGELFTDRTGRLEASELAGLGASSYGDHFNESNENDAGNDEAGIVEKPVEVAQSFQEWGPEPEEEKEQDNAVEMAGSGELSLDLFTFNADDFEAPEAADLFSSGESSNELAFDFDFDMSGSAEIAESVAPVSSSSDEFAIAADLFGEESDFPEFSMDGVVEPSEVSKDLDSIDVREEESAAQQVVFEDASSKSEDPVTSHVVRETLGGLQIMSFDGSADESVDRDFEQFAAGSEDDVDSMFDDVFGDAFDGAFGGMNDTANEDVVEKAFEPEAVAVTDEQEPDDEAKIVDEVSADIHVLEQAIESDESPLELTVPPGVPEAVREEVSEDPSEESLAAILFGEESESFSDEIINEEIIEESASELEVSEQAIDEFNVSEEFDISEIVNEQDGQPAANIEQGPFDINDIKVDSSDIEEPVVEDVSTEIPEIPQASIPAPPAPPIFAAQSTTEDREDSGKRQSENSSELLSLLGALEASEAEEDELVLGAGLSLSHGLHDKSSPVLDDEPDSFSALLASAQKELNARNATSEEERHRDAIDALLGDDDEMPLPPIPVASPFAVAEIPDKRRKGFMSKLFGKD